MNISMLVGIFGGFTVISIAIIMGGSLLAFVNIQSVFITIGGTLAAVIVNFSIGEVLGALRMVRYMLRGRVLDDPTDVITLLVNLAVRARKEGLLALEDEAESIDNEYMKKGLILVVDGDDPEVVRTMMGNDILFTQERHRSGQNIFRRAGYYAPAFGMIGTLIGLIIMLGSIHNPNAIGPGMALALITTLYGSILANLVFLPIAGKLEERSREEIKMKRLIMEGILAIQAGDNPRTVEDKLNVFLSPKDRKSIYNPSAR